MREIDVRKQLISYNLYSFWRKIEYESKTWENTKKIQKKLLALNTFGEVVTYLNLNKLESKLRKIENNMRSMAI